ncbi:P-loop containing nucleoside triphosphate hydrolase protein [Aspergillus sclerotioniger CBS 115572]|uniref:P-loop containing nucleoside triphosphate hydrolase protein n=1 Tax=Aspergillus sclerotioniger CBS 115572 TaxID=1450535 RepID=A0A317WMW4_9EURO|nr:P-loop containing nucleoside triphosphate hydrolase protein [Aspergillus sclerotioniger CBS 115572]PWY87876.1 P-loop containing nucleoside triphosphate hydrolase protein [Aspergillus sclerotioniger CBS 115572]
MASSCSPAADRLFGPPIHGCHYLDFTLLFEQVVFGIIPSACFLPAVAWRLLQLLRQSTKIRLTSNQHAKVSIWVKIILSLALICSQLALLMLWAMAPHYRNKATIASLCLSLTCSLSIPVLSWNEHMRSISPSNLLCSYLFFSTLFDGVQARTLWLRGTSTIAGTFTAGLSIRFLMLIAELQEKQKYLKPPFAAYPPEVKGGMVNRVVFWWLNPLLARGARGLLDLGHLFPIDSNLEAEVVQTRFSAKWQSAQKYHHGGQHMLLLATLSCVRQTLIWTAIPRIGLIGFKIAQPLLLNRVIRYLSSAASEDDAVGRALIGATVLIYVGTAVTTSLYKHGINRVIAIMRSMLVVALYKKTQHLDTATVSNSAALTLMSTDTESICNNLMRLDALFASPIEVGLALFFLGKQVKLACLASVGCALAAIHLSYVVAARSPPRQRKWNQAVQKRIATTASVLGSIRSIKLLGISSFVQQRICDLRNAEVESARGARMLIMWRNVVANIPSIAGPILTFTIFTMVSGSDAITSTDSFTVLALIALVIQPIQVFVHGITQLGVALGCFKRIQDYLLIPEVENDHPYNGVATEKAVSSGSVFELETLPMKGTRCLSVRNASFKYADATTPILTKVNIEIHPSTLTIVTGPTGSGKSSLLKGLIGAVPCIAGSYSKDVTMAYCAQEPWLPNVSVRELVIGPSYCDEEWYTAVLHACALDEDISTFSEGDRTCVGSGGTALSGGQKQRLAMARAIYSRRKLLVLDDVLSALDIITAKKVFDRALGPRGLCRTHNVAVILACSDPERISSADAVVTLNDGTATSGIPPEVPVEKIVSILSDTEASPNDKQHPVTTGTESKLIESRQDLPRRLGDFSVYQYYLKAIGWKPSVGLFGLIVVQIFGTKFPTLWLQYWSDHDFNYSLGVYLGVYGVCAVIQLVGTMLSIFCLILLLVPKSARRLHGQLLIATMNAPYSFFTMHDSGTILNRFSQDLSQIDNQLSGALLMTIVGACLLIAEVMLIAAGNKYIAITVPFVITIFYALQNFYLRTSRQLRLLELEAQSPLYTHFLETASGTDTIRTFGWQAMWATRCHHLVDRAIQPYYTLFCIQLWLNLVLDLMAAGLATVVVTVAVELHSSVSTGAIAVSLLNILGFSSSLSYLITSWTQLETTLGAIARIKNYEDTLPREDALNLEIVRPPPEDWPSRGSIRLDHVYASYEDNPSPHRCILRDVTLTIHSGQKVAVCGRSGSGKSSLMLLLFRLLEATSGSVFIDEINLREIPCSNLRQRLTVIPQDPFLLPGTLRYNLDPSGQSPDDAMLSALDMVGLGKDPSTRQPYSLDLQVSDATFSRGQCQLVSLARALLRRSKTKLLVLDEISGNVDIATERLMFQIIRDHFKHVTVVAVTHRLRCIRDFDQIVIMQDGCIVETGDPADLLGRPSLFKQLWDEQ